MGINFLNLGQKDEILPTLISIQIKKNSQRQFSKDFQIYIIFLMNFFRSCLEASTIFTNSFEDNSVQTGACDIIIVQQEDGTYKSTPITIFFGPYLHIYRKESVRIMVNNQFKTKVSFKLNYKGYLSPSQLSSEQIQNLNLKFGVNHIVFHLGDATLQAQIYLYRNSDRLAISDFDGTVTIDEIGGLINNYLQRDYSHEGYNDLVKKIEANGYKMIWLTMRTISMYKMTKDYLNNIVGVKGPLLMQPQQLTQGLRTEILGKTRQIKSVLLNNVKNLFSENPFVGALGNTEGDAVAYLHVGIDLSRIFIIDTDSKIQIMNNGSSFTTYQKILKNIAKYFPSLMVAKLPPK